jgi:ubiquinol-cytochrome c reductase cytochrome c1 subunit
MMTFKGTETKMHGSAQKVWPAWVRIVTVCGVLAIPAAALAEMENGVTPRERWSFAGVTGHFDPAQLQRGYRVYKEVCSACHGLRLMKYRNLSEPGGPGFTEGQVKTLIKDVEFDDALDDNGKPAKRPAVPADAFKGPFANEKEARSINNGALPPDLSLMARARSAAMEMPFYGEPIQWLKEIITSYQEGGPDYIHSLLTSYHDKAPAYAMDANGRLAPVPEAQATKDSPRCVNITAGEGNGPDGKPAKDECNQLSDGLYYNTTFPGNQIAMPPPLASDGQVAYTDGTPATVDQYARDVSAFLMWTADPKLDERKDVGLRMMIYLLILAGLLWLAKRQIWSRLH